MNDKIRVMVVDDSVVIRRVLTETLGEDRRIEVVGTAANGEIALSKLPRLQPDVITLDLEMPKMDGLTTLKALRETDARLPVILFSSHTERGAAKTLEGLAAGASDYVTKPSGSPGLDATREHIRETLLPKVLVLGRRTIQREEISARPRPKGPVPVSLVVIGCSTGGPNALAEVLPALPVPLRVPVLISQHMLPTFTRTLAERLTARGPFPVEEARHGERLKPGQVWLAKGDTHLRLRPRGGDLLLDVWEGPPENSCRPSVDVMFRSAAEHFGAGTLAVVLTGMGRDGLKACEALRELGAPILVQDEASSVVWGMPGQVARAGLADEILPIEDIGPAIAKRLTGAAGGVAT